MLHDLIPKKELAKQLGVSERTLDRWHARREGPPRINKGHLIAYRRETVEAWLRKLEGFERK